MRHAMIAPLVLLLASCSASLTPQAVNVRPLAELDLPVLASLGYGFADYRPIVINGRFVNDPNPSRGLIAIETWIRKGFERYDFLGVTVDLKLYRDVGDARDEFDRLHVKRKYEPDPKTLRFGGSGDDRYCISPVRRAYSPEFHQPLDSYYSFVTFQKRNLMVTVAEQSRDRNSTAKDPVIANLAQQLAAIPAPPKPRASDMNAKTP